MRNCALQLKDPLLLAINMVKAARLRPEDHINSESVLCCEEAIFESLTGFVTGSITGSPVCNPLGLLQFAFQ